jgi:hypothetical protein
VVFSGIPVSSTNKTDRHDITETLLKVALNTINQSNQKNLANINISTWPNINYSKRNPTKLKVKLS